MTQVPAKSLECEGMTGLVRTDAIHQALLLYFEFIQFGVIRNCLLNINFL